MARAPREPYGFEPAHARVLAVGGADLRYGLGNCLGHLPADGHVGVSLSTAIAPTLPARLLQQAVHALTHPDVAW